MPHYRQGQNTRKYAKRVTRKVRPPPKPKKPLQYKIADVAYKGFKTAMWIKNLINVEHKNHDTGISGAAITYTGTVYTLNAPPQGSTDITRNGDSLLNKKISIRGFLGRDTIDVIYRIVIILDKQNIISTVADYFEHNADYRAPFSPKKDDNRYKTQKIYDNSFALTSSDPIKNFIIDLTELNNHTHFNHGSTTIANNAYKLLVVNNQATNGGTYTADIRHTFIDN